MKLFRDRLFQREQRLKAESDAILRAALADNSRIVCFVRHEYVEFESGALWEWRSGQWMVVKVGRPSR